MGNDFYGLDDVLNDPEVQKDIETSLNKVAEDIADEIREFIKINLYGREESEFYERTYEYLDCLRVEMMPSNTKREYGFKIFFDDRYIHARRRSSPEEFNTHMSFRGEDMTKKNPRGNIFNFIDEGINSPTVTYDGIDVYTEMKRIIDNSDFPVQKLRDKLTKKGYIVDF